MNFFHCPTRVGKYELGKTLGQGAYSKVRMAKNLENGTLVAIKIMDKQHIHKHNMVDNIKREILIMKLINHPYVVQLIDVMASKTKIYLVQEYVSGGELLKKINIQKLLKEEEARKYFQQLIDGVDYFHNLQIYHRDLKLNNILVDGDGDLKIVDFGVSALYHQFGSDGLLHTQCGTPNYIAPEMINNRGYGGASGDLWACGVVLFMLLAGYLPFGARNTTSIFKKILSGDFTCPPWMSPSAKILITRILDPNPQTRMTIAQIRKDEWFSKDYKPPKFERETKSMNNLKKFEAIFGDSNGHVSTTQKEPKPKSKDMVELNLAYQSLGESGLFEKESQVKKPSAQKEEARDTKTKKMRTKETIIRINSNLISHWVSV